MCEDTRRYCPQCDSRDVVVRAEADVKVNVKGDVIRENPWWFKDHHPATCAICGWNGTWGTMADPVAKQIATAVAKLGATDRIPGVGEATQSSVRYFVVAADNGKGERCFLCPDSEWSLLQHEGARFYDQWQANHALMKAWEEDPAAYLIPYEETTTTISRAPWGPTA